MCQYFLLDQKNISINRLNQPNKITINNSIIIRNRIIFTNIDTNSLVVAKFPDKLKNQQSNINISKKIQINVPKSVICLQEIQHLFSTYQQQKFSESKNNKQVFFIITTSKQICLISLDYQLQKIVQIYECYFLNFSPFTPIDIKLVNQNNNSSLVIINQQIAHFNQKDHYKFIIAGFDTKHKIVINSYIIQTNKFDKKTSQKPKNNRILTLMNQTRLQTHQQITNHYDYLFTLTLSEPKIPMILMFKIFHEKGLPISVYTYNLADLLIAKHSQNYSLKPEQFIHKLGCMHNYVHIKSINQSEGQLYVCYTRYVPFNKSNTSHQDMKNLTINSHLWVYNLSIGYTKNIIDIDGQFLYTTVRKFHNNHQGQKGSLVMGICSSEEQYKCVLVKMDTNVFHPLFNVSTPGYPLPLFQSQYFAYVRKSSKNKLQDVQQNNQAIVCEIVSGCKINKKNIYCCMWELTNQIGGPDMLARILALL